LDAFAYWIRRRVRSSRVESSRVEEGKLEAFDQSPEREKEVSVTKEL
jgi:hypothetical protein